MDLQQSFQKLIKDKRLSHSYLLFGEPDLELVRRLANYLENGQWELTKAPLLDFLLISPDDKNTINIETMRAARDFLWQRPLKSPRKTIIINQADALTLPAQNAILKIAEDPPASALLFLLLKDPDVLVNPLISRFQKIYCPVASLRATEGSVAISAAISSVISSKTQNFLSGSSAQKNTMIKEIAADEATLKEFVKSVMLELDKDPVRNLIPLRELSRRWSLISRYNTNKKLQLEAWVQSLNFDH